MKHRVIFLAALLALAGCQSVEQMKARVGLAAPAPQPPPPPDPTTQMPALETRIALLVAEQRLLLTPQAHVLTIDPELAAIARARAADMAAKNYLAHAAPNGDTSASLLMEKDETFQGLLGENLAAQHYTKQSGVDPEAFAKRFLDTWLQSKPHKDNLSFPDYDRTGVGAAVNGDTVYVAQLFASSIGQRKAGDGSVTPLASPADGAPPAQPAEPLRLRGAVGGR